LRHTTVEFEITDRERANRRKYRERREGMRKWRLVEREKREEGWR
jgi:hypothetical protein